MRDYIKRLFDGFLMSLGMFSSIPIFKRIWDEDKYNLIIPMFPIVGLIIGLLWYYISKVVIYSDIYILMQAAIILIIPFLLSGFIHVDGYMDTCDSIFSRASMEKKRMILKDPHVGAFAVIAFVILMLFSLSAIYTIIFKGHSIVIFIFITVLSRSVAGWFLLNCKLISDKGFAYIFRSGIRPRHSNFLVFCAIICGVLSYVICGIDGVFILAMLTISACMVCSYSTKQLGGISGDLCGCILTVSECVALVAFAVII